MKTTVSIGTQAHAAILLCVESGLVNGVSLDGHSLTVDYTGLDPDAALKRAADNLQAVTEAAGSDRELNYATGWFAVMMTALANEQVEQAKHRELHDPNATTIEALEAVAAGDVVRVPTVHALVSELDAPCPIEILENEGGLVLDRDEYQDCYCGGLTIAHNVGCPETLNEEAAA